jgi:hypothetical protein
MIAGVFAKTSYLLGWVRTDQTVLEKYDPAVQEVTGPGTV